MGELNQFEARNILEAERWATRSHTLRRGFPSSATLQALHHRMFDQTWRWAGQFRRADTTIGVAWQQIPVQLHAFCGDIHHQIEHEV